MPPMRITASIGDDVIDSFEVGYCDYDSKTKEHVYSWTKGDENGIVKHTRTDGWMVLAKRVIDNFISSRDGKQYKKPKWAVQQVLRDDKDFLVEDMCKHGCGHPNSDWLRQHNLDNEKYLGVHGCDGCCQQEDE